MTKSYYCSTLSLILLGLFSIGGMVVSNKLLAAVQSNEPPHQTIRQGLAGTQIERIQTTPIAGVFEVTAGNNVFYSDATGRYLLFGHLYDTATQTDLTTNKTGAPQSLSDESRVSWDTLPHASAIITGKRGGIPLAVFLDPDCPYCKALQRDLQNNETLEVHEFLMPLTSLHPTAQADTNTIWCNPNRPQALIAVMLDLPLQSPSPAQCDLSGLQKINTFLTTHPFNATPVLIRADGQLHYGYLSLAELTAWAMAGQEKN